MKKAINAAKVYHLWRSDLDEVCEIKLRTRGKELTKMQAPANTKPSVSKLSIIANPRLGLYYPQSTSA